MAEEYDSLEYTPTWVVALVCSIIVTISLFAERLLHLLGKYLKLNRQDALFEAVQKLKEELMLLGFISLLLTVFQSLISHICIPTSFSYHMLPCKRTVASSSGQESHHLHHNPFIRIAWDGRRLLSENNSSEHCTKLGKVPLLSIKALHQLHIFIFVLAVVHVVFCATTMVLGGAKTRQWKHWENSIRLENLKHEKGTTLHHFHHLRAFITERAEGFWTKSVVVSWGMSFFKQFYPSVTRCDYAALRLGFIMQHCRSNPGFDFHKYLMRVLQTDFKKVVGISWYLWLFVVVFLLLNVDGWHAYFWLSFLPLILLLLLGTKLEHIITRMAQDVVDKTKDDIVSRMAQDVTDEEKDATVKPSDEHFWFNKPHIVLYLIHFILFQNSFEIAFFFWILCTYGFDSCIMEGIGYIIPRLIMGVLIQILCSYSTLPLYAIVTQMGTMFKQEIFNVQLQTTLHGWADEARKKPKPVSGPSSILGMLDHKSDHKSGFSSGGGGAVQMQTMAIEAFDSTLVSHPVVELEGITISVTNEQLDSRQVSHI